MLKRQSRSVSRPCARCAVTGRRAAMAQKSVTAPLAKSTYTKLAHLRVRCRALVGRRLRRRRALPPMLKIDIPPPVEAKPRQRCMECAACLGKDCGVCGNCMDMASFGGLGARLARGPSSVSAHHPVRVPNESTADDSSRFLCLAQASRSRRASTVVAPTCSSPPRSPLPISTR